MSRPDQRRAPRSQLETNIHVIDIESGVEFDAEAIDTCDEGLSFRSTLEPAVGAELEVRIPGHPTSAFKVLRIVAGPRGFDIAGQLKARWSF